jgi:pantothenate kinase type III|tara:strand:+ start:1947 stop:2390 length:444 start_codon:yes stop_codon:yes gene_type:complete
MTNWVKHNAEKYKSEIKSLVEIINTQTKAGVPVNQFTADMLLAMRSGRRITDKMEQAINNIIKRNQPEFIETRNKWVMSVVPKIDLVIERLKYTSWTEGYRANSLHFLKSIRNQAKSRMTLSDKQMSAVTKLYKRIEKNIEKSKNSS